MPGQRKEYVLDRMRVEENIVAEMLADPRTHTNICGLKRMERGVDEAYANIAESIGQPWTALRDTIARTGVIMSRPIDGPVAAADGWVSHDRGGSR